MRFLSVCSGIEAASVAWEPLGWVPVGFAEIEPFPSAVLAHHYPAVPNYGDFTRFLPAEGNSSPIPIPEADLLVGGCPCQSFSVAGKRRSLEDYRGNLTLAFADLFHVGSFRYAVFENVPGILSTKDNAFGCLLGRLVGHDAPLQPGRGNRWTNAGVVSGPLAVVAWRVLDAQYFGVAQRRRRVFVCVSRGAGNWAAAEALLPVGECVSRHPPTRRQAGEGTAADVARSLRGRSNASHRADSDTYIPDRAVSVPLTARMIQSLGPRDVEEGALVAEVVPINTQIATRHEALGEGTGFGIGETGDPAFTLQSAHSHGVFAPEVVGALDTECGFGKATDQMVRNGHILAAPDRLENAVPQDLRNREGKAGGGKGPLLSENQSLTLATANDQVVFALTTEQTPKFADNIAMTVTKGSPTGGGHPQAVVAPSVTGGPPFSRTGNERVEAEALVVAIQERAVSENPENGPQGAGFRTDGAAYTLEARHHAQAVASASLRPRRLTPRECERLQAFPDDYTLIPWRKGMAPDGPRYKALGNSMCVNVMRWIGQQIAAVTHA